MKTFGKLRYSPEGKFFQAGHLAPHVAIAFKRLFPKVDKNKAILTLADTDDTRIDLHWFMQRYPLEHDLQALLDEGIARVEAKVAIRGQIMLPDWLPGSSGFKDPYKPYLYQSRGAAICLANPGLLLVDDVGLGKTISFFETMARGAPLPAAIVVDPHLARQWERRLEKFTHYTAHVIRGTKPYDLPAADLYIFKYSNISGWIDVISKGLFRTVGWDEIQELRTGFNPHPGKGTAKGKASKELAINADVREGLTATPVYNYGDEIWNIMEFIEPGLLGDESEFKREWCGGGNRVTDPDALGSYLRETGYFLRRTEDDEDVEQSMPPININTIEVDWEQRLVTDELELAKKLALTVMQGNFVEKGRAARELDMKMRQLTGVAKARSVAAYVAMLLQHADNLILAGWHREVYDIWNEALARFKPTMFTGSESPAGKDRNLQKFLAGESRVMFISLRSGKGLDGLQDVCNEAVVGEFDWSPMVHRQFFGRVRRPGQKKQCNGHYLYTNGGSDPVLMETLGIKTDQSRGIVDPGKGMPTVEHDDSRIRRLAEAVIAGDVMGKIW